MTMFAYASPSSSTSNPNASEQLALARKYEAMASAERKALMSSDPTAFAKLRGAWHQAIGYTPATRSGRTRK